VIVVYVHGNGNKVREELLKRQWDLALFGRDAGTGSRMACWAPLLHPQPLPDPEFDEAEQLAPEAPLEAAVAAPPELEGYARGMAYRAEAVIAGEEIEAAVGAEALPLPRAVRTRIFEQLVRVTFEDVHAYFFRGFAERMCAVVRAAIAGIDELFVVVAHSLGSIVAYDVCARRRAAGSRYRCRHGRVAARRAGDPGPRHAAARGSRRRARVAERVGLPRRRSARPRHPARVRPAGART
jgi:hypothetical protein